MAPIITRQSTIREHLKLKILHNVDDDDGGGYANKLMTFFQGHWHYRCAIWKIEK